MFLILNPVNYGYLWKPVKIKDVRCKCSTENISPHLKISKPPHSRPQAISSLPSVQVTIDDGQPSNRNTQYKYVFKSP